VDLSVEPGEIVLLTGPSGSGKTTLLTLIGALRAMQEGSARVLGQELRGANEGTRVALRRRIGFIFQNHNLLGFLTARQNVAMAVEQDGATDEAGRLARAADILGQVGLADHVDKLPSQLSGGQRQRVSVARALATDPGLVLADEPTAALDKASGRRVVQLLRGLAKSRFVPILLVTHDPRILDIADRIVAMEDAASSARRPERHSRPSRKAGAPAGPLRIPRRHMARTAFRNSLDWSRSMAACAAGVLLS
jgi:putative ABC transport system ATP-binding protein